MTMFAEEVARTKLESRVAMFEDLAVAGSMDPKPKREHYKALTKPLKR